MAPIPPPKSQAPVTSAHGPEDQPSQEADKSKDEFDGHSEGTLHSEGKRPQTASPQPSQPHSSSRHRSANLMSLKISRTKILQPNV